MTQERMIQVEADIEKRILRFKCCRCDRPAGRHAKRVNLVGLPYRADWDYPTSFPIGSLAQQGIKQAMALVCDECLAEKREIPKAIEWDGQQTKAIYHNVKDLTPLQEAG